MCVDCSAKNLLVQFHHKIDREGRGVCVLKILVKFDPVKMLPSKHGSAAYMQQVKKNVLSCWYIGLTNGGVKSTETRVTEILLEN